MGCPVGVVVDAFAENDGDKIIVARMHEKMSFRMIPPPLGKGLRLVRYQVHDTSYF